MVRLVRTAWLKPPDNLPDHPMDLLGDRLVATRRSPARINLLAGADEVSEHLNLGVQAHHLRIALDPAVHGEDGISRQAARQWPRTMRSNLEPEGQHDFYRISAGKITV